MVHHPAYPGGVTCNAITSQIDLAPTLIALTGADTSARAKAASGLEGAGFLGSVEEGLRREDHEIAPASLFNYNMLSYQDVGLGRAFRAHHVLGQDHQRREDRRPSSRTIPISPSASASAASSMADIVFRAISGRRISIRRRRLRPFWPRTTSNSTTFRRTRTKCAILRWIRKETANF